MDRYLIADTCEIVVGSGLLSDPVLAPREDRSQAAVITQPGALVWAKQVAAALVGAGIPAQLLVAPDGEDAKTLVAVETVYSWLIDQGVHRGDTVVAVGGGSLTDAAGFVASTYLRGIEAVYVPTTLLGAVDAAIGGKTGINLGGKNLVGSFRHPSRVVIDTDTVADLPDELWQEGCAEALKAGLIADADLVALFEEQGRDAPIGEIVRRAVAVKVDVVSEDFTEQGRRAILNYGHTVGHGVEIAAGISHGRAVAIGMVAAGTAAAETVGFAEADRQRAIIAALGLPTSARGVDAGEVADLIARDKKRDAAGVRMVLLEAVGRPVVEHVDPQVVERAIASIVR